MLGPIAICLHIPVLLFLYVGIKNVFIDMETNDCQMTYMFQEPLYLKVKLDESVKSNYPNYNLYYYNEGSRSISLFGVPALFIPGNAGSYKQVRSLGSVALRMAETISNKKKIDFFALDFNEELSGLFGGFLTKQSEFAAICVDHILSMYNESSVRSRNHQTSLFVVGHSMGGLIARSLFKYTNNASTIPIIITQATPHQLPVLFADEEIKLFHESLSYPYTTENMVNITLVSTGGGNRDVMVRTGVTKPGNLVGNVVWTSTVSMPKVWASTDHLCHVWCKQVVMATVRAMYDCLDARTGQITQNPTLRHDVMRYHFLSNQGSKHYPAPLLLSPQSKLNKKAYGWRKEFLPWKYSGEMKKETYVGFNIKTLSYGEKLVALSNIPLDNWIGACMDFCDKMISFSKGTTLLPSPNKGQFMKVIKLDYQDLKIFDWLVIVIPSSNQNLQVAVEPVVLRQRTITANVPFLIKTFHSLSQLLSSPSSSSSSSSSPPRPPLSPSSLSSSTHPINGDGNDDVVVMEDVLSKKSVFHRINLERFYDVLQAFHVSVEAVNCDAASGHSVLKFQAPWSEDPSYTLIRDNQKSETVITLSSNKPTAIEEIRKKWSNKLPPKLRLHHHSSSTSSSSSSSSSNPYLDLYSVSSCDYRINVTLSKTYMAGQFVRFYMIYIPAFVMVQIFLVISRQLKTYQADNMMSDVNTCLFTWYNPFSVLPLVVIGRHLLKLVSRFAPRMDHFAPIPLTYSDDDVGLLKDTNIWNSGVLVLLYFVSLIGVSVMSYVSTYGFYVYGRVWGPLLRRMCRGRFNLTVEWLLLICALLSSVFMCGSCGLFIVLIFHLARVCSSYSDLNKTTTPQQPPQQQQQPPPTPTTSAKPPTTIDNTNSNNNNDNIIHFRHTMFLLSLCHFLLNLPSLVVWVKDRDVYGMHKDPCCYHALISTGVSMVLSFTSYPMNHRFHNLWFSYLIHLTSLFTIPYATVTMYRLNYFIDFTLLTLASHWLLSSLSSPSSSSSPTSSSYSSSSSSSPSMGYMERMPVHDSGIRDLPFGSGRDKKDI